MKKKIKKLKKSKLPTDLVIEVETEHATITIVATAETGRKLADALEKIGENIPMAMAILRQGISNGMSFTPSATSSKN